MISDFAKAINNSYVDIKKACLRINLVRILGSQEIKQRYRRSKLGPFWITISMGVTIAIISVIFSQALDNAIENFVPHVAIGIVTWSFISSTINEGATSFISSSNMIRQLALPLSVYPMKILWKNFIVLLHNVWIIPIVFLLIGRPFAITCLLCIPAFFLLSLNLFVISLMLGTVCARYRDLLPIVSSVLQVLFYVTPIIWTENALNARASLFVMQINPFYHFLEIIRKPLMGTLPPADSWIICLIITSGLLMFGLLFFGLFKKRVAYWV